ncbi:zinc finger protein 598 [Biomphalaria glabrata]|nr:zinc finger protein 598 [Biomphalaria glabrata]
MERSESVDNCPVCHDVFELFGVGPCDHPVCYRCSTRMRVLCDQMDCPICRSPMPQVAFVYNKVLFKDINLRNCIPNRKFKIFFEDEKVEGKYLELLEIRCKICRKRDPDKTFNQLQTHMRREHELFACDLCVTHLKIFPYQRKFYTRQTLAIHRRVGDEDDKSYKGHPLCEFCDTRYNDKDELWKHLRKDHFFCHFCDQRGSNEFYDQYPDLVKHFSESHFLCSEDECASSSTRFTHAFASEIDLKAHKASVHSKNMSKAQSRETRTLELEFQLPPRRQGNSRGGSDYDSGRSNQRSNRRRDFDYEDDLYRALEASKDGSTAPAKPMVEERVPDSVHDFPTLNGSTVPMPSTSLNYYSNQKPKTLEEEFPTLSSQAAGKKTPVPIKQYSSVMNPPLENKPPPPPVKAESKPVSLGSVSKTFRSQMAPKITEDEYPALGNSQSLSNTLQSTTAGWIKKSAAETKTKAPSLSSPSPTARLTAPTSKTIRDDNEFPTLETGATRKHYHLFAQPIKNKSKAESTEKTFKSDKADDESFELPDSYYSSYSSLKQAPVENENKKDSNLIAQVSPPPTLNDFPGLPARSLKGNNSGNEAKKKKKGKKENKLPAKTSSNSAQETNASLNDIALAFVSKTSGNKAPKPTDWFDNPPIVVESSTPKADPLIENKSKNIANDSADSREKTFKSHMESSSNSKIISGSAEPSASFPSADNDNFPSLHTMSTSVQPPKPPPGFSGAQTHISKVSSSNTLSAPPGFKPAPCPPPGFGVSYTYIQPSGFKERNLKLIQDIQQALSGITDAFANFKALSGQFRQGVMEASDYYLSCLALMGDKNFEFIFPELLALLPDITKQQELWDVHCAALGKASKVNSVKPSEELKNARLSLCQVCGQALLNKDSLEHHRQHNNFSDFPTLGASMSNLNKVLCK